MEHPFKRSETTDIAVKIQDETFYLHQQILSFYSTKFRDILHEDKQQNHHGDGQIQEILLVVDEKAEVEDWMTFFLLFYPEHFHLIDINVIDEERIDRLIALGQKYDAEWISRTLDSYFTQKQDGGFVNKEEDGEEAIDYENCERNIKGMLIGFKYKFHELTLKLINFNYCPINELQRLEGFDDLHDDFKIKLAMCRVTQAVDTNHVKTTLEIFNTMFRQTEEGIKQTKDIESRPLDEQLFNDRQDSDMEIPTKEGKTFSVHSKVLGFYSEILRTEWQQDLSSSMGLGDSKSPLFSGSYDKATVKMFLHLIYASHPAELTGSTDFEQLLSLLTHYEIKWPIKRAEEYLIQSNHFNKKDKGTMWGIDKAENQIKGLLLADQYGLERLQLNIIKNIEKASSLADYKSFQKLTARSTYLVLRRCIQERPKKIEDGSFSNEGKAIVKFLDKFYR